MGTLVQALGSQGGFAPTAFTTWPPSSPSVPADLLQELLGQRLPDHRGGNSPTMSPHRGGSGGLRCPRTRLSAVPAGLWVPRAQLVLGATQAWLSLSVHPGFQLGTVLWLRLENSSEEDGDSNSALESRQAVAEQQRQGDTFEAVLERLEALEADVRFLCTELGAEKLLWSSRFLELLQEQQSLRQRLQERSWRWDGIDSPELPREEEDESGSEGESPAGCQRMEPPQQPAPCPGSRLGPAAP
ncbi:uncharacterized protein LOC128854313 isoform X8 [Cuculus canorus]|uniref:uncharacterized protein LOC128854313 isoform X8 n=1 Tax=Cuculus canorus TaxID=55661 RepID=UPI0023AB4C0E|nr:uncharacterized protein LOC128854313 isoform X8 [Cuculus canorus]XP_053942661.1 uncharacterized protein LOC128854313 isoform X8 [Cuculus canorus]